MSVVIRMQRAGGRNYPFFRLVVADSRRARDGRFLEKIGYYNPLSHPAQVQFDPDRVRYWIDRGARPSESVAVLLKKFSGANPLPMAGAVKSVPVPAASGPVGGASSPVSEGSASSSDSAGEMPETTA